MTALQFKTPTKIPVPARMDVGLFFEVPMERIVMHEGEECRLSEVADWTIADDGFINTVLTIPVEKHYQHGRLG